LASAIESLARDPERARQMALRGRQVARDRFGWDRVLESTNRVYGSAMERRRGA